MNSTRLSVSGVSLLAAALVFLSSLPTLHAAPPEPTRTPLVRVVDLNVGESAEVKLSNGTKATVKLLDLKETRDPFRDAVRLAQVRVEVNGKEITLTEANYNLPQTIGGVQIDCSITKGYNSNTNRDAWGLDKDARLRLWPAKSPWIALGTFVYPLKQRWFATMTQMANEPVYVDGGESPKNKAIYYHNDLDFGGCEGLVDVVAATDGLVVSAALETLPGYEETPVRQRYDVIYLLDDRGWYYRYSHLQTIDDAVKPGARVKMGQKIGVLGKEGASGGWTHLHFGIVSKQPSGKWGTQEAYAFAWEAYRKQYQPKLIAVARPHHLAAVGETVRLDGAKSWSAGKIVRHHWQFTDGRSAYGPAVERRYDKPGSYSEILKITDDRGRVAYDFAVVQVLDPAQPDKLPPGIHPTYAPTTGIKAGVPISFKVRSFRTKQPGETWDFGDGSPRISVQSDGNAKALAKDGYAVTQHTYSAPGIYIVRVEHTNEHGYKGIAHLAVEVEKK